MRRRSEACRRKVACTDWRSERLLLQSGSGAHRANVVLVRSSLVPGAAATAFDSSTRRAAPFASSDLSRSSSCSRNSTSGAPVCEPLFLLSCVNKWKCVFATRAESAPLFLTVLVTHYSHHHPTFSHRQQSLRNSDLFSHTLTSQPWNECSKFRPPHLCRAASEQQRADRFGAR